MVNEPLTFLLAFCLAVLAFSLFPSAVDISLALGEARGHSSWNFWYSLKRKNLVLFSPPELGKSQAVGPITRFVVLQRPRIFLAWKTVGGSENKVVEKLIVAAVGIFNIT